MLTGIIWAPATSNFVPGNFVPVFGNATSQDFLIALYLLGLL
jgi:hypothetical protein